MTLPDSPFESRAPAPDLAASSGSDVPSTPDKPPGFWKRRIVLPIRTQLTQGVSPAALAKAVAGGVVCGVFPILGTPSLLAGLAGIIFRLNQAVIQAVTLLMYPLHLLMIPVYIRAGEWLFRVPPVPFSIPDAVKLFLRSPAGFFAEFGMTCVHCMVAWAVSAVPLALLVMLPARPLLKKAGQRLKKSRAQPPAP